MFVGICGFIVVIFVYEKKLCILRIDNNLWNCVLFEYKDINSCSLLFCCIRVEKLRVSIVKFFWKLRIVFLDCWSYMIRIYMFFCYELVLNLVDFVDE